MKELIKNHGGKMFLAGFLAGVLMFALMAFSFGKPKSNPPREIVLITSETAFFLPDQRDKPNPPITLKKGQPVKLVLRNEDPEKVLHCFTITGLNVKTAGSIAGGESETLTFTPRKKGTFAYACLMHTSMVGKLVIE
jgi:FtsP/CotA-like multicopper oxidase with cupredoxin domain